MQLVGGATCLRGSHKLTHCLPPPVIQSIIAIDFRLPDSHSTVPLAIFETHQGIDNHPHHDGETSGRAPAAHPRIPRLTSTIAAEGATRAQTQPRILGDISFEEHLMRLQALAAHHFAPPLPACLPQSRQTGPRQLDKLLSARRDTFQNSFARQASTRWN